jgi:hypothetical protein
MKLEAAGEKKVICENVFKNECVENRKLQQMWRNRDDANSQNYNTNLNRLFPYTSFVFYWCFVQTAKSNLGQTATHCEKTKTPLSEWTLRMQFYLVTRCCMQFCDSVAQAVWCLTMGWTIGRSRFDPQQGKRNFLLAPVSRPALGPTQPPIQWVLGVLSPGVKHGRGVTLTTHPHLVPRLSMSRSYTSSPPMRLHGM